MKAINCCSIVLISFSILFFVIGIIVYFVAIPTAIHNKEHEHVKTCDVTLYVVNPTSCSYQCGCITINKILRCNTCYYTCYDLEINLSFTEDNKIYNYLEFYDNYRDRTDAVNKGEYLKSIKHTCYYFDVDNSISLKLYDTPDISYIASIVMFSIGGLIFIVTVVWYLIVKYCYKSQAIHDSTIEMNPLHKNNSNCYTSSY